MSDMWASSGGARPDELNGGFGEPGYGEGLSMNEAFSVDRVFKLGFALLQEQPAVVLLAGGAVFLVGMLSGLANQALNITTELAGSSGTMDPNVTAVLGVLLQIAVSMMFQPIVLMVMAGAMVASGQWVRNGQSNVAALFTSFSAALRVFLASLVVWAVSIAAVTVCLGPSIGAAAALGAGGSWELALVAGGLLGVIGMVGLVWVAMGLQFAAYAAVLDNAGPLEAVQASWDAARGARLTLFVTMFVFGMIGMVSACFCGLPQIVFGGVNIAGYSAAWLLYARRREESRSWAFIQRNLPDLAN